MERLCKGGVEAVLAGKADFFRAAVVTDHSTSPVPYPSVTARFFRGFSEFNDAIFRRVCSLAGVYFAHLPFSYLDHNEWDTYVTGESDFACILLVLLSMFMLTLMVSMRSLVSLPTPLNRLRGGRHQALAPRDHGAARCHRAEGGEGRSPHLQTARACAGGLDGVSSA